MKLLICVIAGFFVGVFFGIVIMAIAVTAGREDMWEMENEIIDYPHAENHMN